VVGWLIAINVVLWLANWQFTPGSKDSLGEITNFLSLQASAIYKPWLWWKFLTCGFAHDSMPNYMHLVGNMIGLFFFGRIIEQRYGAKEFLAFFLVTIVICSVLWGVTEGLMQDRGLLLGASGGITGVIILFIFLYPKQTVLLFFVIPMPAWVLGVVLIVMNLSGAAGFGDNHIAYTVHLFGAGFAVLYYKFNWRIMPLFSGISNPLKRRPKLRLHDPDTSDPKPDKLAEEEDRILAKIHREGVESLTRKERKMLEKISQHYKDRQR
jgi:membrane associated rhomboid family serine protease